VLVHTNQPGVRGVTFQVKNAGAARCLCGCGAANRRYLAVIDDDGLIVACGCTGAVNNAHVLERDNRIVEADKGLNSWNQSALRRRAKNNGKKRSERKQEGLDQNGSIVTILPKRGPDSRLAGGLLFGGCRVFLFFAPLAVLLVLCAPLALGQELVVSRNLLRSKNRFNAADLLLLDFQYLRTI